MPIKIEPIIEIKPIKKKKVRFVKKYLKPPPSPPSRKVYPSGNKLFSRTEERLKRREKVKFGKDCID